MDPSYESSEDEAEAMAKAMGFSSFGTQGPTKKRKFNPKVDAIVDGQELTSLDRGGKKGQGSGGNDIPLGKPRLLGNLSKRSQQKFGTNEEVVAPAYIKTNSLPLLKGDGPDGEGGPNHIDTSLPPPIEDTRATQEKIDTILADGIAPLPQDLTNAISSQIPETSSTAAGKNSISSSQNESKSSTSSVLFPSVLALSQNKFHVGISSPGRRGQKNEFWYIGYYDPSFNENPWARLERVNGMRSKGTWTEGT